jgi:hypothetical protein
MDIDHSAEPRVRRKVILEFALRHAISVNLDYVIVFLQAVFL